MDRTNPELSDALRRIPSVDSFLRREGLSALPKALAIRESRAYLESIRNAVKAGQMGVQSIDELFSGKEPEKQVQRLCESAERLRHARVINATGIVLHTGLGRAPLAPAARQAVLEAGGYAVVELDPESGLRNQREERIQDLLCSLTGVGGALVVNNNAAMVNLVLRALAEGREVVVSRGELVEIGGGFRMPDVMEQAGCRMVEVGTTNRTHLRDFQRVINESTAMLLKIHPSNFRIEGFNKSVELKALAALGADRNVLVFEDLGSGLMVDATLPGLEDEPTVMQSLETGAPLVSFSGDKLLGGPQCGILLGDRELVARVRAHPLYRAFRCDKLVLAALEATLQIYHNSDPLTEIPTLRAIARPAAQLEQAARALAESLGRSDCRVVPSESFVGSGANPARPLPSYALAFDGGEELARALRSGAGVGIFSRIADGRVLLDMRTLMDEDHEELTALITTKLSTRTQS
ncbi:MAG: L-seryl-tRNA(Sec) selenium transferase [Planctomycetota bacterium]|jgi:L-seryl-tRNA(Ser) seleniumtransferase